MTDRLLAEVLANAARELQLELDATQHDKLLTYLELLARWNRTYNLTSIRNPLAMMTQHVVDCLAIVPSLKAHLSDAGRSGRLLDVGSGAGLPGLVLAVALPKLQVVCLDSVGKKAAFIAQAAATLGQENLNARHARVETFAAAGFDVIASRALTTLSQFVLTTAHLLGADGQWLAMKGVTPRDELNSLDNKVKFHVEQIIVPGLDAARCIVWLKPNAISEHTLSMRIRSE